MTESDVLLDTWAWCELLQATPLGEELRQEYLSSDMEVHASALTLGELAIRFRSEVPPKRLREMLNAVRVKARLHPVTPEIAEKGGMLRARLRKQKRSASLADAIILVTARNIGAVLVSADEAFDGQPDVTYPGPRRPAPAAPGPGEVLLDVWLRDDQYEWLEDRARREATTPEEALAMVAQEEMEKDQ